MIGRLNFREPLNEYFFTQLGIDAFNYIMRLLKLLVIIAIFVKMYHVTHLIQVLLMYRPKKNIFFCTSQDPIEFYDIIEYSVTTDN